MIHRFWHRAVYGVMALGLLALLVFVVHASVHQIAGILPEHALAAVDQTDSQLVGWWKLDESTGSTAADSSASGHSGTISGTPSWTTSAAVGTRAFSFDGSSNMIETIAPSILSGSSVFSVTFWARPSLLSAGTAISIRSGTPDDTLFTIEPTNTQGGSGPAVNWPANAQLIKGGGSLADGAWHFYAFVSRSATDHELFVDGTSVGTSNASKALPSGLTNITIGAKYSVFGGAGFFNGGIDDVRVFSRNLSSGEISTLYALGSGGGGGGSSGDTTAPSTPTNLSASAGSSSQINLTWSASTDNTAVTGYKIYRGGVQIATSNTTSYSNTGLNPSTSYNFTVAAYDAANNTSSQSSSASAMTQASSGGGNSGGNVPSGPGAGTHSIYVDQTLASDCAGTYSIASRNCSGSNGYAYVTLQDASDVSRPGNTVFLRGGTYHSICYGNQCHAVTISQSGTSGNMITYMPYNNESVVFTGQGYSDADSNNDGMADGPFDNGIGRESLILLPASYVHLSGFELTLSEGSGMAIDGSFDVFDNISAHDNWGDGYDIGSINKGKVEGDTFTNIESYKNRHGTGLDIGRSTDKGVTDVVTGITIQDSLFYQNGKDANGVEVLPIGGDPQGGGNSDGLTLDKFCVEDIIPPFDNMCTHITIKGNVAWLNTDDGFDMSFSHSVVTDNISFGNGPTGAEGFKNFESGLTDITYANNVSYANMDSGFQLRMADNPVFLNNISVANGGRSAIGVTLTGNVHNNITYMNNASGILDPAQAEVFGGCSSGCLNNWPGGDPKFYSNAPFKDTSGHIVVNLPSGTIAQKVAWLKSQFHDSFSLQPASAAIDAGTPVSYTNTVTGQGVSIPYYGSAPDMGAYEYQVGQVINPPPPPIQDTTAPTISGLTATSITDTTATIAWNTNEGATTQIQYGTNTSYSQQTTKVATLTTSHSQSLTGLTPSTLYYYRVLSNDGSNNPQQQTGTFTTTATGASPVVNTPAPTQSPTYTSGGGGGGSANYPALTISNVKISGTSTSGLTVTWMTNNPATSQIQYGLTSVYGSQTFLDPTFTTSHSVKLTGLTLNSVYHIQVRSKDSYGTLVTSADIVLTISQAGAVSIATPIPATSANTSTNLGGGIAVPTTNITASITTWLVLGTTNSQVKTLQQILNAHGYTVAASGVGSWGNETNYFGPATLAALEKFQCAKIQVCSGSSDTTGYGATGPKTRAALAVLAGTSASVSSQPLTSTVPAATEPAVLTAGSITTWLYAGVTNSQVKTLQQILNAKGYTVSTSGGGSKGNETTYFGPATGTALKKFQCAQLSVCSGTIDTTGYGATGPKTRAALSQM